MAVWADRTSRTINEFRSFSKDKNAVLDMWTLSPRGSEHSLFSVFTRISL